MPPKKIKKKVYQRSKWMDFNKLKVTFIFKQFAINLSQFKHKISWLGPNSNPSSFSPLTNWFLSLPRTKGRAQQIVKLAFIYHYGYTAGKGTEIGLFKNKDNPFFNSYLNIENNPEIGIDKINAERKKHRQVLRFTTEKVMRSYITKTNQRKPGKRVRMTKKNIEKDQQEDFFKELQKFFNQLVKEPTMAELTQQYEDPEEFDEVKEYNSDNEQYEWEDSQSEDEADQDNEPNSEAPQHQLSQPVIQGNIPQTIQDNEKEDSYCVPSPVQRKKSLTLSIFDSFSSIQSHTDLNKINPQKPKNIKETSSDDEDIFSFQKKPSIDLNLTDQEYERNQTIIAAKQRQKDYSSWTSL